MKGLEELFFPQRFSSHLFRRFLQSLVLPSISKTHETRRTYTRTHTRTHAHALTTPEKTYRLPKPRGKAPQCPNLRSDETYSPKVITMEAQGGPVVGVRVTPHDHTTHLKAESQISVAEVGNERLRWLVHSPYTEREHQLDLNTLDDENALLARALARMRCLRPDYATSPYTETFNWDEVHQELKDLVRQTGKTFRETSFYIVAFRSQVPPTTIYEDLGTLDKAAHKEANDFGGFLK